MVAMARVGAVGVSIRGREGEGGARRADRASYVHPIVIARYVDDGEIISLPPRHRQGASASLVQAPEERALIAFLDRHFPERRSRPRAEPKHQRAA